jgi:GrpB-like predicted nucleotidyltransferase (UPF0157 family)
MPKNLDEMTDEERWRLFPVILTPHDPAWAKKYLKEKEVVERAAGSNNVVRINHIGSTAVPGLIAKPTIDILLEIKDSADTSALITGMQKAGYRHLEQPDKPPPQMMFIKGYTPRGFKGQVFHVHIRYSGDWEELYFRDYLISHPGAAMEYARLKVELRQKHEFNRDAYTDAKGEFIAHIVALARQEAGTNPRNPG